MGRVCCFTGHRTIPSSLVDGICKELESLVFYLIDEGYTEFRTGGAYGFDTFSALAVLKAKKTHPEIKLRLFLACPSQADYWNEISKQYFDFVKEKADEVIYSSETYRPDVYFMRNRALVDGSDICVVYLTTNHGGTYYTRNYAQKKGLQLIYITADKK